MTNTKTTSTLPTKSALGLATIAGMPRGLHFEEKPGAGAGGGDPKKTGNDDNPGLSARQREELDELLSPLKKLSTENSEALAKIGGSIEELTKAVSEGKPKDEPKGGKTGDGDDVASVVAAAVTEALRPHTERLDAIEAKETESKEQSEVTARVRKYIEAKRPGLLKDEKFAPVLARIAAAKPKDDEAVGSELKRELDYLALGGVDVEKLGAEPEAEGARESGDGLTKEEKIERIKNNSGKPKVIGT